MLLRIACTRCRLASLWTDDPRWFLGTVCPVAARCQATLVDEEFRGVKLARRAVSGAQRSRRAHVLGIDKTRDGGGSHDQRPESVSNPIP